MENLSSYFKKFRLILSSNDDKIKIISEELFKIIPMEIPKENIVLKDESVIIQTRPTIKSEIFIHKEEILRALRDRGLIEVKNLR